MWVQELPDSSYALYKNRNLGLGHTCGSKSCLIRVMRFTKILYHDVDSPNTPKGAQRVFWLQVG